jgi:hypothetical protein
MIFRSIGRWLLPVYFSVLTVGFGLIGVSLLHGNKEPFDLRSGVPLALLVGFMFFGLERGLAHKARTLSRSLMAVFVSISLGTLLLDMGLDGSTAGHGVLLNLSSEMLQIAITAILIDYLLREDDKRDHEEAQENRVQLDTVLAKLDAIERNQREPPEIAALKDEIAALTAQLQAQRSETALDGARD